MNKKVLKNSRIKPKKKESTRARQNEFLSTFTLPGNLFCISRACRQIGISRRTYYKWMETDSFRQIFDEAVQSKIDQVEACLFNNIQAGDTTAIIFFLKTVGKSRGYIEGERVRTVELPKKQASEILDKLIAGEIDTTGAALSFDRLGLPIPEGLRVLLAKSEPPAPPVELPPAMSDEELEAGYQAEMARIDKQEREWLPERREEVQKLKMDLKDADSWGTAAATDTKLGKQLK